MGTQPHLLWKNKIKNGKTGITSCKICQIYTSSTNSNKQTNKQRKKADEQKKKDMKQQTSKKKKKKKKKKRIWIKEDGSKPGSSSQD